MSRVVAKMRRQFFGGNGDIDTPGRNLEGYFDNTQQFFDFLNDCLI